MREGNLRSRSLLGEFFACGALRRRREVASAQRRALKKLISEGTDLTRRMDPGEGIEKHDLRMDATNWLAAADSFLIERDRMSGTRGSIATPGVQTDFALLRMIVSHRLRLLRGLSKS